MLPGRPASAHCRGLFVRKSDKKRLRLILDTRCVNDRFREPEYTQLPTASAWSGVRTSKAGKLQLFQADVDNAFYRVRLAEGMIRLAGEAAKCLVLGEFGVTMLAEVAMGKVEQEIADMKQPVLIKV